MGFTDEIITEHIIVKATLLAILNTRSATLMIESACTGIELIVLLLVDFPNASMHANNRCLPLLLTGKVRQSTFYGRLLVVFRS